MSLYQGLISLIMLFFMASCGMRSRLGSSSGAPSEKYLVSFFKGKDEFTYFLKPIKLSNRDVDMIIDVTFVKKETRIIDSPIINFTLIQSDKIMESQIGYIYLDSFALYQSKQLFNEKKKNKTHHRFSAKIDVLYLKNFHSANSIHFKNEQVIYSFPINNKAKKAFAELNTIL